MTCMLLPAFAGYAHNTPLIRGKTMSGAAKLRTIDTHTHILADATIKLLNKEIPKLAIKLTAIDGDDSVLDVAGVPYKPFPRGGHNIERRFADMDAAEVDVHVLSVSPQTWLYNQEAAVGVAGAMIQNDEIARLVKEHPDR